MAYSRESFPRTYPGTQVGQRAPVFFSLETALSGVTIRWTHISHRASSVS